MMSFCFAFLLLCQTPRPLLDVHVRHDPYDPVHRIWISRLHGDLKRQPRENVFFVEHDGRLAYKVASRYSKRWVELPSPEAVPEVTFWIHFLDYLDREYWYEEDMALWNRERDAIRHEWRMQQYGWPIISAAVAERDKPVIPDNPLDYLLVWK